MTQTRILVVDDFELIREFICDVLSEDAQFKVVGEANDGLSAVQMAAALRPDIVTLDVNMPILDGFEAAEMIRSISKSSRILFISSECSADHVQEAYRWGASGYILKDDLVPQLLPAVRSLQQNRLPVTQLPGIVTNSGTC